MEKIILTDADGCLLNWNKGFETFMESKGLPRIPGTDHEYNISPRHNISTTLAMSLVTEFNEGPEIEFLEPFKDSVQYVDKLARLGFRFIVVTSIGDHPNCKIRRTKNLENIFGNVFDDIHCISMGASKAKILLNWADTRYFWIEDHMRQAEAGYEAGLRPLLINHPHNHHYNTDLFPKVSFDNPWEEIYNRVLADYF